MFSSFSVLSRFIRGLWFGLKDPEFKGLLIFVIILLFSGTIFYSQIEHWTLLDALYFSVTTLTTIGFGDLVPKTDFGKIFTIVYIFIGVGTLLGFINLVAHHSKENDPIHKMLTKRSSEKEEKS